MCLKDKLTKPLIMGIVNITPDSFSDGGKYLNCTKALAHALNLLEQGADIIDIGGESTRPGAKPLSVEQEKARILPVVKALRKKTNALISVDTSKPLVMEAAIDLGADIINDVYGLRNEGAMAVLATSHVSICLMHMQGVPQTMQAAPHYPLGVTKAIKSFFAERIATCEAFGINKNRLILDSGFGFGKTIEDNLTLIKELSKLKDFNLPLLCGVSRKSTIGTLLNKPVNERLIGSLCLGYEALRQGANILRVHDVRETLQIRQIFQALNNQ